MFNQPDRRDSQGDAQHASDAAFEEEFAASKAEDCGTWDLLPFLDQSFWGFFFAKDQKSTNNQDKTRRSWPREPFCGLSHLLGAVASLVACLFLFRLAVGHPTSVMLGAALYGVSLVVLYTASGLYHSLHGTPGNIAFLQRLDHSAIFLLIAGTFAPLCLITLRGASGSILLLVEYALALTGIVFVLYRLPFPASWRVGMYLVMGWLSVLVLGPIHASLALTGVVWYVSGGLLYSLGTIILATDRPHLWPGRFSAHDLWHVFVLGGSVCHFILIYCFVMPRALPSV